MTVGGKLQAKSEKIVEIGAVVAVKGLGRFSISEEVGKSKKGKQRLIAEVMKYVRLKFYIKLEGQG